MSEFIVIQDNQITSITKQGIHYTNDAGDDVFIDFHTCYLNFTLPQMTYKAFMRHKEINNGAGRNLGRYIHRFVHSKEVGRRNSDGIFSKYEKTGKPHITFYTEPMTVFEFDSIQNFWKIAGITRRSRWHLFDET